MTNHQARLHSLLAAILVVAAASTNINNFDANYLRQVFVVAPQRLER